MLSSKVFFTAIIPTFNRSESTIEAINSVLNQSFDNFELILIDDGQEESHRGKIFYFLKNIPAVIQTKVSYILLPKNYGVSSARNAAIYRSKGEYLAFLDSDDLWHSSKLEEQFIHLERNSFPFLSHTDEIWIRNGQRVNPKLKHQQKSGDIFFPSLKLCLISPSTVVIKRKELMLNHQLFDESLPVCEDYDLWLRLTCRQEAHYIPKKLVTKHGGHDDQLSRSEKAMDYFRLKAMRKLLITQKKILTQMQMNMTKEEFYYKKDLLVKGALKHQNFFLLQKIDALEII